jgi:hypothetical protein
MREVFTKETFWEVHVRLVAEDGICREKMQVLLHEAH